MLLTGDPCSIKLYNEASLSKGCLMTITLRLFGDMNIWGLVLFCGPSNQLLLSASSKWVVIAKENVIEPTCAQIRNHIKVVDKSFTEFRRDFWNQLNV